MGLSVITGCLNQSYQWQGRGGCWKKMSIILAWMSKLVRVAHCQSESALTCHPPTHSGDWPYQEGGMRKTTTEGGRRETKKLHMSTWHSQLLRCTIIVLNRWITPLLQKSVDDNFSSSPLVIIWWMLPADSGSIILTPPSQRRYLREDHSEAFLQAVLQRSIHLFFVTCRHRTIVIYSLTLKRDFPRWLQPKSF